MRYMFIYVAENFADLVLRRLIKQYQQITKFIF